MDSSEKIVKSKLRHLLYQELKSKNILSISFVGSFIDKEKLSQINDIDLIIIVKNLNKQEFKKIIKKVKNIKITEILPNKKIFVNNTFGPLKFNKENNLVVHLMMYDVTGHKDHVLKSPFTVYDWERSVEFKYKKMSDIYSVGTLQLQDFIKSRRGINNYIDDIQKNCISYREYKFDKNKYYLLKKNYTIKKNDKFEFYFHIVKNLISNYIKFKSKKNTLLDFKKINNEIKKNFNPNFYSKHIKMIQYLLDSKENIELRAINNLDRWIKIFLRDFQKELNLTYKKSKKIIFKRHFKTILNNDSFLGQRRNPSISIKKINSKKKKFSVVYTGPLKRCIESAKIYTTNKIININKNLTEIDYGLAEGLFFKDLQKKYPKMISKWNSKLDPKFPNGENYRDVCKRIDLFIKKIVDTNFENMCVITHNVLLRCLVGKSFNVPIEKWFKISIPHGLNLEFILLEKKIQPNINRKILKKLLKNVF